jgi:cellulose synthase/poly-beta-1,6-N-acetylglucosamine synthase-like glycosyltransferase
MDRIIPVVSLPGVRLHAACGPRAEAEAKARGLKLVATAGREDFHEALRWSHGPVLARDAAREFDAARPELSARRRLSWVQMILAALLALAVAYGITVAPAALAWACASLVAGLFFLSVIMLRILALLPVPDRSRPPTFPLADGELPRYSVLVPLYRETAVLGQLLNALTRLDYPSHLLDIKLLVEDHDLAMRQAIAGFDLPPAFEMLVVPPGQPRTKPRALNYGLRFARGELLTIFDAEDVPEPDQLRRAAETFASAPPEVACLQAELVFYNHDENWLARQFTVEYATLFGLLLPALSGNRLPVALGGTSNHFRIATLRDCGAWDAYNVTEDADLGMRLARDGFSVWPLPSRTYEEANVALGNWLRQRARWLKGFLATWLVHMRNPLRLASEVGFAGFWALQALTIGVFASALLHPLCTAGLAIMIYHQPEVVGAGNLAVVSIAGLSLAVLVLGYVVSLIAGFRGLRRLGIRGWYGTLLTMPFYWLLMAPAAWIALWQFVTAPSYWGKTTHGLSRTQRRPDTMPGSS